MGIVKCTGCGCYMHDDEVVWVEKDDTHDIPYCVSCSPEVMEDFEDLSENED